MKTIKKKLFSMILVFALCLSAVPMQAAALWEEPDAHATREMVATALWELEGEPVVNDILPFTDVSQEADYVEAVRWAAGQSIVNGVGGGKFLPDGEVTREQLAVILYRYAKSVGMDVSVGEDANILSYDDSSKWSDWAVPALQWAVATGILADRDGFLDARGPITQTETASAIQTLCSLLGTATALRENYTLERVVILSRHNIRSPLSGKGSVLGDATPHTWFDWTSDTSELSLRGGTLETIMGQYFRKYLVSQGLFEENEVPKEGEVRFYANAKQRTIATARYFSAGMFPVANTEIETHAPYDTMDPVFEPRLTYMTEAYREAALAQIAEMGGEKGLAGLGDRVKDSYDLISRVLDLAESKAYADGTLTGFATDDTEIILDLYKEPGMKGSLRTATTISDALVLQYYEEADPVTAAFGEDLSLSDWKAISAVKDYYGDVLFTAPLVAVNVANPLIREIRSELTAEGRKFTFLCGHDSNVGSVLAALGAEDYTAPKAIEAKTPIGVKLVIETWVPTSGEGETMVSARLVYQSVDQLRGMSLMTLDAPPVSLPIRFQGMEQNADGLYRLSDLMDRLNETITTYDQFPQLYGNMELDAAA
jgi:glucose-1-phosphatase